MSQASQTLSHVFASTVILTAFLFVLIGLAAVTAVLFQAPEVFGREKLLTDFDAFYIAGDLALQDRAGDAYHADKMVLAQQAFSNHPSFLPWTYPPSFTLIVEALAHLPLGVAYLVFTLTSFAFYIFALRRIAGPWLPGVLIAILPLLPLIIRTGQNGFLTGGLIGWFLLAFMEKRRSAGIPMGLMIVKPHLAAGIALLSLLERRWATMAVAASVVVAVLGLATVVYGIEIWADFFVGVREAGQFLAAGYYPLFRMSSIYAWLRSFGTPAPVALLAHGAVAVLAVGLFSRVWWRSQSPRIIAASVCVLSLFISPYNYDYDLAILGLAVAFLLPVVIEHARPIEITGLIALMWLATGYGLARNTSYEVDSQTSVQLGDTLADSLIAPVLLVLIFATYRVLQRMNVRQIEGGDIA